MSTEKKLYRSTTNKMLAGVCGGLAEYVGMDPTLMRLIFVVVGLFSGITPVVYIVMWIVVPEQGAPTP